MPKKLFIGLERPVPPSTRPLEKLSPKRLASFRLVEFAAYQTSVFWHQAMKAVAPQTSPSAAIDWMAQRRSAASLLRDMAAPRADFAETPQQLIRIDRAGIDCTCKRGKLLTRNPWQLRQQSQARADL